MTPQDMKKKRTLEKRRAARTRAKLFGTAERPRLTVHRSLKHISAQLIDDVSGKTLAAASDLQMEKREKSGVELAALIGTALAEKAKAAKITKAIFDRGSYRYHGQIKALADAARASGLEF